VNSEKAEGLQERFYSLEGQMKYAVMGYSCVVGPMFNYMGHDRKPLVMRGNEEINKLRQCL